MVIKLSPQIVLSLQEVEDAVAGEVGVVGIVLQGSNDMGSCQQRNTQ